MANTHSSRPFHSFEYDGGDISEQIMTVSDFVGGETKVDEDLKTLGSAWGASRGTGLHAPVVIKLSGSFHGTDANSVDKLWANSFPLEANAAPKEIVYTLLPANGTHTARSVTCNTYLKSYVVKVGDDLNTYDAELQVTGPITTQLVVLDE